MTERPDPAALVSEAMAAATMPTTADPKDVAALLARLAKARTSFGPIRKTAVNPHFKSKYAPLDELQRETGPSLNGAGLVVVSRIEANTLRTYLYDVETAAFIVSDFDLPDEENPQKRMAAVTYGRRCNLACLLDLVADEDDDGARASATNGGSGKRAGSAGSPSSAPAPLTWFLDQVKKLPKKYPEFGLVREGEKDDDGSPWGTHWKRRVLQLVLSTTDAETMKKLSPEVVKKALKDPDTGYEAAIAAVLKEIEEYVEQQERGSDAGS